MADSSRPSSPMDPRWAAEVRMPSAALALSATREAYIVHELSQHLDEHYCELIAGGTSPEEAERLTLAEFSEGNLLGRYMAPLRQSHTAPSVVAATPSAN